MRRGNEGTCVGGERDARPTAKALHALLVSCLLASGLTSVTSVAGTITLETQTDVNKHGTDVEIVLRIGNKGDDSARNVTPKAQINGEVFVFSARDIGDGQTRTFTARRTLESVAAMKPGTYPVSVVVAYTDSDGTQHHAPAYGMLQTVEGR